MTEISVDTDGRPGAAGGSRYVNGSQDLMDSHTTASTNEYGQGGLRYADPDEDFMGAIGAGPAPEPDHDDHEEETIYVDELTGEQFTWDELTEDEQEEMYERQLSEAADASREEEIDAEFDALEERYPRLRDDAFVGELRAVAEGVAVWLEGQNDQPGLAAGLLDMPSFYERVLQLEFDAKPALHGDEIFLELWQDEQPGRLAWEAG